MGANSKQRREAKKRKAQQQIHDRQRRAEESLLGGRASARAEANRTPPAIPRPPPWIWALIAKRGNAIRRASRSASSALPATRPRGISMPNRPISSLA